jgi:8-oxo-dGTP pyrophosphatase MutT (NUDIX family)
MPQPKTATRTAAAAAEKVQYATLPYRIEADGSLTLLLVTSRETRRWVVPKGWPMKGKKPYQAAAREAYEEAGIAGKPEKRPIGAYRYWKRRDAAFSLCRVEVFPLQVDHLEESWPEQGERTRQWFDPETAASLVDEPGLESLITSFSENWARRGGSMRKE